MEVYSIFTALSKRGLCLILPLFLMLSVCFACKKGEQKTDSTVSSAKDFTELIIDSTVVLPLFRKYPISPAIANEVVEFYTRRNYQFGWFNKNGMTCGASNFYTQLKTYSQDFGDNSLNSKVLDSLMTSFEANPEKVLLQKNHLEQLDLLLTSTFFEYAHKVYGGTTKKASALDWFIPRKKKNYQILLDSLVSSELCKNLQEPLNQYYIRLRGKLKQYRNIQKNGGFPPIEPQKKAFVLGQNDFIMLDVKRYLFLSGDLVENDNSPTFTDSLSKALINFQHRMGLNETGTIDRQTITEFNKPIEFRIKQMMVNMERLRWIPVEIEKDYLLINIPEFRLHIFENNKQVWMTNVVVGKDAKQTSIFRGNLSLIILNPYWGIPKSIVKNEILPHIQRNPNYLADNNMEVIDGNYRQKPGKNNALGKMKFMFPNNYHIYLHDTPSKGLFEETNRAFSHGCIRVENPKRLAYYLLRNNSKWNTENIDKILETDNQVGIRIEPTVPVYIAYFTAWVDEKGQLNFRNDLYNLDKKLSEEIF
jgi:L,D-transpeptidase YcbB